VLIVASSVQAVVKPNPPQGVTAKPISTTSVLITWNPVLDATRYKVMNETTGIETPNITGATQWTWAALTPGKQYRFVVRACNVYLNCSLASAPVYATMPLMPLAPTNVKATAASASSAAITWSASANSTRYKVRYVSVSPVVESPNIGGTSYTWTSLKSGSQACFAVIGCNIEFVCGPESVKACATLPSAASLPFDYPVGTVDGIGWLNNKSGLGFLEGYNYGGTCGWTYHPGVDMNQDNTNGDQDFGAPVYAAADGVVLEANSFATWGNLILIEHTLGDKSKVQTLYGHLDKMLVAKGATVTRRQQIGTVGKGDPKAPVLAHLHFEVRKIPLSSPSAFPCGQSMQYVMDRYYDPLKFVSDHRK
jgi:Peptidase family M23/Fibronectin type III domain